MICGQCGTAAAAPAAGGAPSPRCDHCKFPLGRVECRECTAGLFGGERFCPSCGAPVHGVQALLDARHIKLLAPYLPERVLERLLASESGLLSERKYVSVVFAEVAGASAPSEDTPAEKIAEGVSAIYEGMVAAVHRFDGTVDKFVGDSVMAVFGAPTSHDNDPERAVCCALEMMAFLRDHAEKSGGGLSLSIGIHAGPVVAGSVGGHGRLNYTVVGDAVNVAQRLVAVAGSSRILATKEIFERAREVVRFKQLPPIRIKGKRNPLDVWEAHERRPRSAAAGQKHVVVGRVQELETLLLAAREGQGSGFALVGEAGAGRSAFADALLERAVAQGVGGCRAACPPYAGESTAGLLTESVAQLLKIRIDQGVGAIRDGKAKVQELGFSDQEASLLLAGASREKLDSATLDYETTLRATCAAWLRVLGTIAASHRVLVVLEDLQWATPTEWALLDVLLGQPMPAGVTLLCSFRPEGLPLLEGKSAITTLDLPPLEREETRALVAGRFTLAVVDDAVVDRIQELSHGNPRMVEEILQSYVESGLIFRSRDRWILSPKLADSAVPPALEGLVAARIDELDVDARRFLQAAAVVAMRFSPEMVRRVAGLQIDLEWATSQLLDRRIVVPDAGGSRLLSFVSALYRTVAADGMPAKDRKLLHLRTGKYLEETVDVKDPRRIQEIAHHLANGPDAERASSFLLRAARRLEEIHQVDSAMALLEKLLQVAAPRGYDNHALSSCENELDEALYRLGMLNLRKGLLDRADDLLQWAYGRSRQFFNGNFRVWSLLGLARVHTSRGRVDESRKFLEMAAVDSEGMRDPALVALSLLERARLYNVQGEPDQALVAADKALLQEAKIDEALRKELPEPVTAALILLEKGKAALRSSDPGSAERVFAEALKSAEAGGDVAAKGEALVALARIEATRGQYQRAQALNGEAIKCFRAVGDRLGEGRCFHNVAMIDIAGGNTVRAAEAVKHAEKVFTEVGHREGLALVSQARMLLGKAGAQA